MGGQPTVNLVFSIAALMAVTSLAMPLARLMRVPYTVFIAGIGLVIGLIALSPELFGTAAEGALLWVDGLQLTSDGLLNVFLPPLVFAAGLSIDVRRLTDELGPVILLALVAVLVCTGVTGLLVSAATGMALTVSLLLGAIVATTDSTAVVAILRELGAPRRLTVLLEGESLFNDAAAIVLFSVLAGLLVGAGASSWPVAIGEGLAGVVIGAAFGWLSARLAGALIARMEDALAAEITLTIALAYIVFVVAENYLASSGVVAVVSAAMTFAQNGRTQISAGGWPNLLGVWRMLEFWATSLVFLLAAMTAPMVVGTLRPIDMIAIATLIAGTIVARAAVLFGLFPLIAQAGLAAPIASPHNLVILWGGLRGAVTIALALAISETATIGEDQRRFIVVAAIGYTLFTLFINATTLRPLIALLGLNRLSAEERALAERVRAIAEEAAGKRIARFAQATESFGKPDETVRAPARAAPALARTDGEAAELRAALVALAARERQIYLEYFFQGTITRTIADALRVLGGRMLDAAKTGGIPAYQQALWATFRASWRTRLQLWLHRRFGLAGPLSASVALRLEILLAMYMASRDLKAFAEENIALLSGPGVGSTVLRVLDEREVAVGGALDILHLQYTNFLEAVRERHVARTRLHLEGREYDRQRRLGLISPEIFNELEDDRRRRLRAIGGRPRLDVGERVRRMLKMVPLFADLGDEEARAVVRMLRPRLYQPGATVIREGEAGSSLFIIASGKLHVQLADVSVPLTEGDFVGEMALLSRRPRSRTVVARGYAYLLELEGRDLKRLMRRMPALKAAVERKAAERQAAAPAPQMMTPNAAE